MLHIVLLILKIIGITILSILGLVLFALLVALFVPVIYRIKGAKHENDMHGWVKVFWLFITANVSIDNKDKEVKVKIRILGIPLEVFQKIGSIFGKAFKGISKLIPKRKRPAKSIAKVPEVDDKDVTKEMKSEIAKEVKTEVDRKTAKVSKQEESKRSDNIPTDEVDKSKEGLWNRIKTILIKIYYFPQWLYEKVRKIYLTIKGLYGKMKQWKEFLASDTFKRALKFAMSRGNALRKHTLPRKIIGNMTYGFDDPSITGQTLAALSVIAPFYKGKFKVVPMFNQKILEGDILMKGHVFGFTLVRIAWSVYRNKDIKEVIHHFSQKEA